MVAGFPEQAGISYLVGVAILGLAVAVYAALASRAEQYRIRRIREITNEVETWHGKIQNYKAELAKFTSEQDEERKEFRHKFEEKFAESFIHDIVRAPPPDPRYLGVWIGFALSGLFVMIIGGLYTVFGVPVPGNEIPVGPFWVPPFLLAIDFFLILAIIGFAYSIYHMFKIMSKR